MSASSAKIDQAAALYNNRRFTEANGLLIELLQDDPQNPKALSLLAGVMAALGNVEEGMTLSRQALAIQPELFLVQVMAAHVCTFAKEFERAETHFQNALSKSPKDAGTLYSYAHNLLAQSRFEDALKQFEKVVQLEPLNHDAQVKTAALHGRLGNFEHAKAILTDLLDDSPRDPEALNELGLVQKSLGRDEDALTLFQKAVNIDPGHAKANLNLATALQTRGDADAAADYLDRFEKRNPTLQVSLLNALVLPTVLDSSDVIDKWRSRLNQRLSHIQKK